MPTTVLEESLCYRQCHVGYVPVLQTCRLKQCQHVAGYKSVSVLHTLTFVSVLQAVIMYNALILLF